jgi:hypothetical protein
MNSTLIADMLAKADSVGPPSSIYMPVKRYMELRSEGCSSGLDIITDVKLLKQGKLGVIFGMAVYVHRKQFVVIKDKSGDVLIHLCEFDGIHEGEPADCTDPGCIIKYVMTE